VRLTLIAASVTLGALVEKARADVLTVAGDGGGALSGLYWPGGGEKPKTRRKRKILAFGEDIFAKKKPGREQASGGQPGAGGSQVPGPSQTRQGSAALTSLSVGITSAAPALVTISAPARMA
jgi:hypothetical protein